MMDFIMVPAIIGIITFGVYKLFELYARRRERLALIEKLGDKISATELDGKLTLPSYGQHGISSGALKGGLLMLGIGLGLLVAFVICCTAFPYYTNDNNPSWKVEQYSGIVYGACTLLFGGAGLLTAFLIEMKMYKKDKEKE